MQAIFKYRTIIIFIFSIMMVLGGIFVTHNSILIECFYLIYSILIYLYFSKDTRRYLYFLFILYAITTSGNSKYVYLFMLLYLLLLIKELCQNKFVINDFEYNKNLKYSIFFFVFLVYMVLSIFIAKDKNLAIGYLGRYCIVLSIFVIMLIENINIDKIKETLKFLLYIYIGILALGTIELFGIKYGLRNIFMDKNITYDFVQRIPEVFYYNPNNYSVVLNLGVAAIFINLLFSKDKKRNRLYTFLIFISEIQIIFAQSRVSWIVLLLTFIFILVFGMLNKSEDIKIRKIYIRKSLKAILLSILLFFSLSLIPSMKPYYGKIADSVIIKNSQNFLLKDRGEDYGMKDIPKIEIGEKGSENERVTLMYNVVNGVITEKNYLGFGVGNIGLYIKEKSNTYGISNIHSFWFEFLGDFGLPMFMYLIIIYCNMMWDNLKLYKIYSFENRKYFLMFLVIDFILVFSAFAPSTVLMFSPFWITLGMSFSLVSNKLNYKNL
ncbi:O-antigen ligase family protein [Clostridium botulinum]|uniref:O-antigen ligase family protein n=1 Tax=Clostridium botulinum TaxID=1491 RepID=UPI0007736CC2|nr:O-antigen ligase family protein [Clostridium botulinum]